MDGFMSPSTHRWVILAIVTSNHFGFFSLICSLSFSIFLTQRGLIVLLFLLYIHKDDEPIAGRAAGRDHTHVRKFLSQHHKKLPWKPEVAQKKNSDLCLFSFVKSSTYPSIILLNDFHQLSD